mmetsp:Transcript_9878/g.24179  ORF Transcript_9878/g.24179 Transcript_9878/m.24179 type:complete len:371 (+) Transcript_9878:1400-2512(+)
MSSTESTSGTPSLRAARSHGITLFADSHSGLKARASSSSRMQVMLRGSLELRCSHSGTTSSSRKRSSFSSAPIGSSAAASLAGFSVEDFAASAASYCSSANSATFCLTCCLKVVHWPWSERNWLYVSTSGLKRIRLETSPSVERSLRASQSSSIAAENPPRWYATRTFMWWSEQNIKFRSSTAPWGPTRPTVRRVFVAREASQGCADDRRTTSYPAAEIDWIAPMAPGTTSIVNVPGASSMSLCARYSASLRVSHGSVPVRTSCSLSAALMVCSSAAAKRAVSLPVPPLLFGTAPEVATSAASAASSNARDSSSLGDIRGVDIWFPTSDARAASCSLQNVGGIRRVDVCLGDIVEVDIWVGGIWEVDASG